MKTFYLLTDNPLGGLALFTLAVAIALAYVSEFNALRFIRSNIRPMVEAWRKVYLDLRRDLRNATLGIEKRESTAQRLAKYGEAIE
jgi:hypothetical protein